MVDQTFIFTDPVNNFLRNHIDIKNRYIIYASFLMDCMIVSFMTLFYFYWGTYRIMISYVLFFGCRMFIQVSFTFSEFKKMLIQIFNNRKPFTWADQRAFYGVILA